MSESYDGFLTEPLDHVRAAVRQKYADWRSLLTRVNRLAVANQHSIVIHYESSLERYAAVLFARTLTTTQASILVLEVGLIPQANVLLRSALETLFALVAIAKEPSVVDELIQGYAAEQKRAAQNLKRSKDPVLKQIANAESAAVELTPFRGHFIFWEGGVHDVETKKCISAGVPATDGRVGPVGPQPGRAVAGV